MNPKAIAHISQRRILFSPLNWGWGHVSRSIPILKQLLAQDNAIWIACNEAQQEIYAKYFPAMNFVALEGYPFHFRGKGNFAWDLVRSFSQLARFSKKERAFVDSFCREKAIDLVIGDHRYFFRHPKVDSIFVTHQVSLPLPWYLKFAQLFHRNFLNQFTEIWVLDTIDHQFAGKLSRGKTKIPQRFLGAVSRLEEMKIPTEKTKTVVLVSGPEPYAEQFYAEQKRNLKNDSDEIVVIYKGKRESTNEVQPIDWLEIDQILLSAKKIIARSGYSTIMDAHFLDCEVEWHPTKGQWEQEYLKKIQK